jgi:hypothetical protein
LKDDPMPWQTLQASPSDVVFEAAWDDTSFPVWQAVQAAVVGGEGLINALGLVTLMRDAGTGGKWDWFTWHLPQSARALVEPEAEGYRTSL